MENLLTRRNVIIAGAVVIIIIGVLVYFGLKNGEEGENGGFLGLFPSATPTGAPEPGAGGATGQGAKGEAIELPITPQAAQSLPIGTLIRLSDANISSLAGVGTTSIRYHKNVPENLGHLFERRADGSDEEKRISNFTIPQVLRVVWAPDARRAVIFYNLDDTVRKLLIDYSTTTPRTNFLPDSVSDAAFSPDSRSLAFINDLGDSQNIFVATSDFRNQRKILDNNIPNFELSWPSQNFIALKTKSSYAARGFLYTLNINTGEFNKIAEGLGLDAVWSPDGSGVIYSRSAAGGNMQNIKFIDVRTLSEKEFNIKTIAEKCVFLKTLKNAAYCAVSKNPSGALPDDWWKGKISFTDDFVLIDTATGQVSPFIPTPLDVVSPKILADDSYLLFQDKTSGFLWGLKLKQ